MPVPVPPRTMPSPTARRLLLARAMRRKVLAGVCARCAARRLAARLARALISALARPRLASAPVGLVHGRPATTAARWSCPTDRLHCAHPSTPNTTTAPHPPPTAAASRPRVHRRACSLLRRAAPLPPPSPSPSSPRRRRRHARRPPVAAHTPAQGSSEASAPGLAAGVPFDPITLPFRPSSARRPRAACIGVSARWPASLPPALASLPPTSITPGAATAIDAVGTARSNGGRKRRVDPAEDPDCPPGRGGIEGQDKAQEGRACRHHT